MDTTRKSPLPETKESEPSSGHKYGTPVFLVSPVTYSHYFQPQPPRHHTKGPNRPEQETTTLHPAETKRIDPLGFTYSQESRTKEGRRRTETRPPYPCTYRSSPVEAGIFVPGRDLGPFRRTTFLSSDKSDKTFSPLYPRSGSRGMNESAHERGETGKQGRKCLPLLKGRIERPHPLPVYTSNHTLGEFFRRSQWYLSRTERHKSVRPEREETGVRQTYGTFGLCMGKRFFGKDYPV